jgi:peptidoglycan/xylan/chitin deacetylase (PgdA/CDA1 family)
MRRPLLIATGAAAASWTLPALAPVAAPVAALIGAPRRVERPGEVAITFDDGPHPEGTPAVLDALAAAGARATFFLVGEQVERNPALAAEIAAAGHAVESHGHVHRNQLLRTGAELEDDLHRADAAIADATGRRPLLYRPPYGIFSWYGIRLAWRGWTPLLWSRWGRDWAARATPESIAAKVTEELAAGDVLLLHDADTYSAEGSHRRTAAALPRVLERIADRGLAPVAL